MRGDARVPYPLAGEAQSVSYSTSARTAAGVGAQTRKIMIYVSSDAHYRLGNSSVTATVADTFIPGGAEHFIQVRGGEYVAFIQDSAAGTAWVSEFAY